MVSLWTSLGDWEWGYCLFFSRLHSCFQLVFLGFPQSSDFTPFFLASIWILWERTYVWWSAILWVSSVPLAIPAPGGCGYLWWGRIGFTSILLKQRAYGFGYLSYSFGKFPTLCTEWNYTIGVSSWSHRNWVIALKRATFAQVIYMCQWATSWIGGTCLWPFIP